MRLRAWSLVGERVLEQRPSAVPHVPSCLRHRNKGGDEQAVLPYHACVRTVGALGGLWCARLPALA